MKFLKIPEVAECLQCSENSVREMIIAGKLHAVRLGSTSNGDYRISEVALLELGVGGPRPIMLSVADVADFVATPAESGSVRARPGSRLHRRGRHV